MPEIPFLSDIVVVFGTALAVAVVSSRVALPPLVAYLLAGTVVGPFALGWISDTAHVEVLAEVGVAFILFSIGLELPLSRLKALGSALVFGGSLQVALTAVLGVGIFLLLGLSVPTAILLGFCLALSSTAIVLRLVQERRELDSPHGRLATGILIAQDLLIVPLLVLVPFLAGTAGVSVSEITIRFGGGIFAIVAVFALGRWALPYAFRLIADTKARELLTLAAMFLCLGGGYATESLGFSLALGGFLAGVLLAESEYHHQIIAETGPFRDVLASLFFVTMGMLLDLGFVRDHLFGVLAVAAASCLAKFGIIVLVARVLGFHGRAGILAGAALAQVGEFSLVLVRRGHNLGLLTDWFFQLSIATAVVTMLATPALLGAATKWLGRRRSPDQGDGEESGPERVLIFGYGTNGKHLTRVLKEAAIPYLVVDSSSRNVREAREDGVNILFGDCTRPEILRQAGLQNARMAIIAISDPDAARITVRTLRDARPELFILARARTVDEIQELQEIGASSVVAEEFEASIEMAIEVLRALRIPGNIIQTQEKLLRAGGYEILRRSTASIGTSAAVHDALSAGTGDTYWLAEGSRAVGETLLSLGLRERTGASAVAVIRGSSVVTNPRADEVLRAQDILVLIGSHAEVADAFEFLSAQEE